MSFTAQDLYSIAHEAERVAAIGRRVFDPGLVSFGANVRRLVEEYAYDYERIRDHCRSPTS